MDGFGKVIRWPKPRRLEQIRSAAELFHQADIDILAGLNDSAAIDSRIEKAATRAGIGNPRYSCLEAVLRHAAYLRHWRVGDLDAVLWAAHAN